MVLNGKRTKKISETTRKLIHYITEAKNRAHPQIKYKPLKIITTEIRADPKDKEEAVRQHWQEIFKFNQNIM